MPSRGLPSRLVHRPRVGAGILLMVGVIPVVLGAQGRPDSVHHVASPAVVAGDPVRGKALMNAFRDSLPANSGNRLRCTSCHLEDGTRASAMPWLATAARYPRYRARRGSEETLAQRVNECVARSLAGRMLPEEGPAMRDMLAYLETLRTAPRPAGVDTVRLTGHPEAGRRGFAGVCARCHGTTGQGTPMAPAVWGRSSYSIGAGLARQSVLATFLRHNMPVDHAVTLTDQQAADIAAFVLAKPRQDHPGKERDWPQGDAPVDVAYPTTAARVRGQKLPAARPLLPRRVAPHAVPSSLSSHP